MPESLLDTREEEEEKDSRRRDPEILAMERVLRILDALGNGARARVVAYLMARYVEEKSL